MTGLSCDHSYVEETPMAVLGWMPVSLSVCFSGHSVGKRTHRDIPGSPLNGFLSVIHMRPHAHKQQTAGGDATVQ